MLTALDFAICDAAGSLPGIIIAALLWVVAVRPAREKIRISAGSPVERVQRIHERAAGARWAINFGIIS
jgi:hypothetical protein